MNRVNSSRQSISAKQRNVNYHPNGAVAAHIGYETVAVDSTEAILVDGDRFLVASRKFAGRYFVVSADGQCSASDERVKQYCLSQVQAYMSRQAA